MAMGPRRSAPPGRPAVGPAPHQAPAPTPAAPLTGPRFSDFRFRWRWAVLVFLLAAGYRAFYLYEAAAKPDFNLFYMDQEYHLEWARGLATGEWHPPYDRLHDGPFFRAPLYPYFLALLFKMSGGSTLVIRLVQMLIGSVSCVLAYAVAARCFGQRVGVITGVLCALYWVLAYFDGELLLPVLEVLLVLLGFLFAFIAAERRSAWWAGLAGLVFGLFAITRPNILVLYPFAVWWAVRVACDRTAGRRLAFAILFAIGCALPPALVTVRNRVVGGDWVVVASQGGVNFYIGNNPESNGMQAVVPGTRQTWWGGYDDTVALAEAAAGRPLKPSEVSGYWFGRAFAYIREQPGHWLRLTLVKALAFVGDVELPNNEPYEARRASFRSLRLVPLSFAPAFGLFVVAVPLMWRGRPRSGGLAGADERLRRGFVRLILQFVLVYSLSVIAFFVTGRYRVPLVPFVLMGSAVTLTTLAGLLGRRRFLIVSGLAALGVLLVGLLRVDWFDVRQATRGFAALTEAQDKLASGDLDGAISGLEVIRAQRSVRAPQVYLTLVQAYFQRNRPGDMPMIAAVVQEGLAEYPDDPDLLWYAVLCEAASGSEPESPRALERYLTLRPNDVRALYLGFRRSIVQGRLDEARQYLLRAEVVDPNHPLVAKMVEQLPTIDTGARPVAPEPGP